MGRPTYEEKEYRGRRYRVVVIRAPDNRWTFVVECRAPRTYATMQEAEQRGEQHAKDMIDRESV
jgi:hypothetical protein